MLKVLKEKVDNVQKQMGTSQRDGSSKAESKWNARNQKHGNRNEELTPLLNTEMGPGEKNPQQLQSWTWGSIDF